MNFGVCFLASWLSFLKFAHILKNTLPAPDTRRRPRQRRSRETVEAILEAVIRILKKEGFAAINTNRIAEVAGVSIGSVYQYFPEKRSIFAALHQRHMEQIDRAVETTVVRQASASLQEFFVAMVDALIEAHNDDPELYHLLFTEVPHRADTARHFAERQHGTFRQAIAARTHELRKERDPDRLAFVVSHMVESLIHGALYRRPPGLSLEKARKETVRAILAYLQA